MSLIKLQIRSNNQKYLIIIGNNILFKLKKLLKESSINFNKCLLIVDKKIQKAPQKFIIFLPMRKIKIIKVLIKSQKFF